MLAPRHVVAAASPRTPGTPDLKQLGLRGIPISGPITGARAGSVGSAGADSLRCISLSRRASAGMQPSGLAGLSNTRVLTWRRAWQRMLRFQVKRGESEEGNAVASDAPGALAGAACPMRRRQLQHPPRGPRHAEPSTHRNQAALCQGCPAREPAFGNEL